MWREILMSRSLMSKFTRPAFCHPNPSIRYPAHHGTPFMNSNHPTQFTYNRLPPSVPISEKLDVGHTSIMGRARSCHHPSEMGTRVGKQLCPNYLHYSFMSSFYEDRPPKSALKPVKTHSRHTPDLSIGLQLHACQSSPG